MTNRKFEFNGITYQVTSSIRLDEQKQAEGRLYNFSLAILDKNNRKQFALNCLSVIRKQDARDPKKVFYTIHAPMQLFFGGRCASIVAFPDARDAVQVADKETFITKILLPILNDVANDNLRGSEE